MAATWRTDAAFTDQDGIEALEPSLRGAYEATPEGLECAEQVALNLTFPPPGLAAFRARARFMSPSGAGILVQGSGYSLAVGQANHAGAQIELDQWPVATTGRARITPGTQHELILERLDGRLRVVLDDEVFLDAADPRPDEPMLDLEVLFPEGMTLHELALESQPRPGAARPWPRTESYDKYVCIDFYDDVIKGAWSEETFRAAMEVYQRHDIRRVYFIYHYGVDSGFWNRPVRTPIYPGMQENIDRTRENVGDFLPAAVRAAHTAGLPIFAVLKPYESGMYGSFPEGSEGARLYGRIPRLGGPQWWSPHFTTKHPELRIARDVSDVPSDLDARTVKTIVLNAEADLDASLDPSRIRLLVSPNNGRYTPYTGPVTCRKDSARIVLDDLEIRERFVVLTVDEPTFAFGNVLRDLMEVRDAEGRALPVTFANRTMLPTWDYRETGFAVDVPYANAFGAMDGFMWVDGRIPFGFALGREQRLQGAFCAAEPEVESFWMEQVEKCLDAGVDGIDFRIVNHNRTFDWEAFGRNAPVVDAFREQVGVDIRTEPFDREALRRLRGSFYTDFLRRASARLRQAGKGVQAHVSQRMGRPSWHTEMEIDFDWPTWIGEGLIDEVTIKMQAMRTSRATEAAEMAREMGLKVNFCPYLNALPRVKHGPELARRLAEEARAGGADGLILYENAAFMAAEGEGVTLTAPWILEALC